MTPLWDGRQDFWVRGRGPAWQGFQKSLGQRSKVPLCSDLSSHTVLRCRMYIGRIRYILSNEQILHPHLLPHACVHYNLSNEQIQHPHLPRACICYDLSNEQILHSFAAAHLHLLRPVKEQILHPHFAAVHLQTVKF